MLIVVFKTQGVEYEFESMECRDNEAKIFSTEICSYKGKSATVVTSINRPLNKINVSENYFEITSEILLSNFCRFSSDSTNLKPLDIVKYLNLLRSSGVD